MKRILIILMLLAGLIFIPQPAMAKNLLPECSQPAASQSEICQQNNQQANSQGLVSSNPVAGPKGVLQTVTNIIALLTGIVAVGMIIASAVQFITAGGNFAGQRASDSPSKAKKARANLISAVIGLIIVALAWTIITFIVQKFVKS